jgi:hypothetical protein
VIQQSYIANGKPFILVHDTETSTVRAKKIEKNEKKPVNEFIPLLYHTPADNLH